MADGREERCKRAWELKQAGWSQKEIAETLGVTEGAVSQWMKSARAGGEEALKAHPTPGARPRLTAEQQAQIPAVLAKGASAYGFVGEVLEQPQSGRGDQTGVWGELSSRSLRIPGAQTGLQSAETRHCQ